MEIGKRAPGWYVTPTNPKTTQSAEPAAPYETLQDLTDDVSAGKISPTRQGADLKVSRWANPTESDHTQAAGLREQSAQLKAQLDDAKAPNGRNWVSALCGAVAASNAGMVAMALYTGTDITAMNHVIMGTASPILSVLHTAFVFVGGPIAVGMLAANIVRESRESYVEKQRAKQTKLSEQADTLSGPHLAEEGSFHPVMRKVTDWQNEHVGFRYSPEKALNPDDKTFRPETFLLSDAKKPSP